MTSPSRHKLTIPTLTHEELQAELSRTKVREPRAACRPSPSPLPYITLALALAHITLTLAPTLLLLTPTQVGASGGAPTLRLDRWVLPAASAARRMALRHEACRSTLHEPTLVLRLFYGALPLLTS